MKNNRSEILIGIFLFLGMLLFDFYTLSCSTEHSRNTKEFGNAPVETNQPKCENTYEVRFLEYSNVHYCKTIRYQDQVCGVTIEDCEDNYSFACVNNVSLKKVCR
jgi:hypothetical protein